jgi:hypothetical protein
MITSDIATDLLHRVERLRPLIQDEAAAGEANRQLSSAVYDVAYGVQGNYQAARGK